MFPSFANLFQLTLLEEAPGEGEGWCIDPRKQVYANLCGVCIQGDKNTTFTMDIEQYTTSFADLAKQAAEDHQITAYKVYLPHLRPHP
jgi:hypothetical protein